MFSPPLTGRDSRAWKSLRAASDASTVMEMGGEVGLVCATAESEVASMRTANARRRRKGSACDIFNGLPREGNGSGHRRLRASPNASSLSGVFIRNLSRLHPDTDKAVLLKI